MAREQVPAFQFYPKDFLSDGKQAAMSLAEVGAYVRLMSICWLEHDIPNDTVRLARMVGATQSQMKVLWPAIAECFQVRDDDPARLFHPRLEKERAKQAEFRERQKSNGLKGGRPVSQEKPTGNPDGSQNKALRSPSPSPSPTPTTHRAVLSVTPARRREGIAPLTRSHLGHAWCGERICVPNFLHEQFVGALGTASADEDLRAFYVETHAAIPDGQPIEADVTKFWRPRQSARWSPQAGVNPKTAGNLAAAARFIARGQQ